MSKLTQRQATVWSLQRMGLIEPFPSVLDTVAALVAVQAQSYRSATLAITSRCREDASVLKAELAFGQKLAIIWTVRGTLHVVPAADAPLHLNATRQEWNTRWGKYLDKHLPLSREQLMVDVYPKIRAVLGTQGKSRIDIVRELGLSRSLARLMPHLLKDMCYMGLCARGAQTNAQVMYYAPGWENTTMEPFTAQCLLARKYWSTYGPATAHDFAYWSGLNMTLVHKIIGHLRIELTQLEIEGMTDVAYILQEQVDAIQGTNPLAWVSDIYLPAFDVLLLAYKDKRRFIDDGDVRKVFLSAARVEPTLLIDGRVAGVWKERTKAIFMFAEKEGFNDRAL